MSEEEPKMTREEWRRLEARQRCTIYGHDWEIVYTMGLPISMYCGRSCGVDTYQTTRMVKE